MRGTSFTIRNHTFDAPPLPAGLYVVATPIGNLGDMTIRGLETLAAADVIACEDTRTTGVLLARYGIEARKLAYTEHNADTRGPDLIRRIAEGRVVALVSDAGTPLVADPGGRLVRDCVAEGLTVVPLPGASAPLAALMGAGLDAAGHDFRFCGFLPPKAGARKTRLKALADGEATLVFFEAPTRIAASLAAMAEVFGADRPALVARELTKMHETFHRGTLSELATTFRDAERVRGEMVVVVPPAEAQPTSPEEVDAALLEALSTMRTKDAATEVANATGIARATLYARALELKRDG